MAKTLYVCRTCGYVFPDELGKLIDKRVQVFCEMCGTPFSLAGVEFKQPEIKSQRKPSPPKTPDKGIKEAKSSLSKAIKVFNTFAYVPVLIFSGVLLGMLFRIFFDPVNWVTILSNHLLISIAGILIVIYDIKVISPKIKEEKYEDIILDSFCYGIVGCVIYGTGVIILIKGILIIIAAGIDFKRDKNKAYEFGLVLHRSLNRFSAKAGFIILLIALFGIVSGVFIPYFIDSFVSFMMAQIGSTDAWLRSLLTIGMGIAFLFLPIILLLIDLSWSKTLADKRVFSFGDFFKVFLVGAICTAFLGIGIFILFKGILLFILFVGKPIDAEKEPFKETEKEIEQIQPETPKLEEKPLEKIPEKKIIEIEEEEAKALQPEEPAPVGMTVEMKAEPVKEEEKASDETVAEKEKEAEEKVEEETGEIPPHVEKIISEETEEVEEPELKLHDSLLPVKDDQDRKVVKEYFSKIFTVLSRDLRKQIHELDIPKSEKKEILNELAFLTNKEKERYIEALSRLYREIPKKLIKKIKELPNIKPQHYDKIVEQLKYMDEDEQVEFVQFLEKNA